MSRSSILHKMLSAKVAGELGVRASMSRVSISLILLASSMANAWECGITDTEPTLVNYYNTSKEVFVGRLVAGSYDKRRNTFEYSIDVEHTYKGDKTQKGVVITFKADWSAPLTLSESYLFMTDALHIGLCDYYQPFEFEWENRQDIEAAKFVKEIIGLWGKPP